jgi:hypothetical protein
MQRVLVSLRWLLLMMHFYFISSTIIKISEMSFYTGNNKRKRFNKITIFSRFQSSL